MTILDVRDLNVSYHTSRGEARAVRNVSFSVQAGESFGLVGESGCGKSTIAQALMRYLPRNATMKGQVLFRGQDLITMDEPALQGLRGNRIAMVYQDPQASLNPVLTIEKQLVEVVTTHEQVSQAAARQRAIEMLERVRMQDPAYVLTRYPHQLSGGMQQRVVIAMALMLRPDLVIMDEPTTGLDVTVEASVLDLLSDLRREFNMATLFISHNLAVIARVCDNVGVMYAGELIEEAPARELFTVPHHPYTLALLKCSPQVDSKKDDVLFSIPGRVPPLTALPGGCAFAARCPLADQHCVAVHPLLEAVDGAHEVRCFHWKTVVQQPELAAYAQNLPAPAQIPPTKPLLNVERLKVYFSQAAGFLGLQRRLIRVVDSVDFEVRPQQTLGIVGESGCGKSTIAGALAGLKPVTDGKVAFLNEDFSKPIERRRRQTLRSLQMVFQNPDSSLNPRHTIAKSLTRPLRTFKVVPRDKERETVLGLLRAVNLDESYMNRLPRQLSGGEKQRVAIARAFAGNPELIICDEPISSLDVSVQATVLNLLQKLQRERSVALVFIAHDLNVVRYLSDQVAVIYLGKIAEIGPAEAIFQPPYHPYTESLVSAIPTIDNVGQPPPILLEGAVPSPANPPSGCRFHTRCPRFLGQICVEQEPPEQDAGNGHKIFCHIPLEELTALQAPIPSEPTQ